MSIKGILPVIPTPFRDGAFDAASFRRMVDRMAPDLDGYTLLGSTGEAPSMTTAERMAIAEEALAMTPAGMTVVVGVTHTSVADSVALARHAEAHGASAVMCAMPYYFANTTAGMLAYLDQIDRAIGVDLVLYDNPGASRTVLGIDTVLGWAETLEHLTTVKLTDHDLEKVPRWREAGLSVLPLRAVRHERAAPAVDVARAVEGRLDGASPPAARRWPVPGRCRTATARPTRRSHLGTGAAPPGPARTSRPSGRGLPLHDGCAAGGRSGCARRTGRTACETPRGRTALARPALHQSCSGPVAGRRFCDANARTPGTTTAARARAARPRGS